jgi:ribonuclease HI
LEPNQKGFIPGRSGDDHIRDLNRKFYNAVKDKDKNSNLYVLFVDTKKAFDSIDHDYILLLLKKIGFPVWLCNLVRGLLSGARVNPILGGSSDIWIHIDRGVKQGCPLSPLLFALAYDPLLTFLSSIDSLDTLAFADDMALVTTVFHDYHQAMNLINDFRTATGLGINTDKTTILAAKGNETQLAELAADSPWPDIKVVKSHVYLGILIGREVSVEDVFAKALQGFEARATSYLSIVRKLSHAMRILVFNTFLFTKLSYIMQYYSLPYGAGKSSTVAVVERVAATLIINFHNAYSYTHLLQQSNRLGPSPALRDGWITSVAVLAAKADPADFDGITTIKEHTGGTHPLLMTDHTKASLVEFISWHLNGCDILGEPRIFKASDFFKTTPTATRKAITDRLARVGYQKEQDANTRKALERKNLPADQFSIDCIHGHYAALPPKVPAKTRKNQFHIIFNALATARRRKPILFPNKAERDAQPTPPCPFCGVGDDDATHFFDGTCEVVRLGRTIYGKLIGIDLNPETLITTALIQCKNGHTMDRGRQSTPTPVPPALPPPPLPPTTPPPCPDQLPTAKKKRRRKNSGYGGKKKKKSTDTADSELDNVLTGQQAVVAYDSTAHKNRISPSIQACSVPDCTFFKGRNYLFRITSYLLFGSSNSRATTALLSYNSNVWTDRCNFFISQGDKDKLDVQDAACRLARTAALTYIGATTKKVKSFGKAGQRSDAQTAQALAYANTAVKRVPNGDAIAFTDGASRGNPGPSGSGTLLYIQGRIAQPFENFAPLGKNSNNFAELWAIGIAIARVRDLPKEGRPYKLHIFTDSAYSIGCLTGGFVSLTNKFTIRAVRRAAANAIKANIISTIAYNWVPGHAGLDGNDMADHLANAGADASRGGSHSINIDAITSSSDFTEY